MKVLHFYKTYLSDTMGGVEQVIYQIARATTRLGVTSEVLSLSPRQVERTVMHDGHKVHRCRSNFEIAATPFSASAFLRFRQLAQEADIIHYHFPYPFIDVLHFATRVKKPALVTYHSDIIKQKLPENNGGFNAIKFAKTHPLVYDQLSSDHPIDLCRYQVANCYMGKIEKRIR